MRTHIAFVQWLQQHGACAEGVDYIRRHQLDEETAYRTCAHPAWMVWYLAAAGATPRQVLACATVCVEAVLPAYTPEDRQDVTHLLAYHRHLHPPADGSLAALTTAVILVVLGACSLGLARAEACRLMRAMRAGED